MGGISSHARAQRFIEEFNQDFIDRYGLPSEMLYTPSGDAGQGLYFDASFGVVRFCACLREVSSEGADGDSVDVTVDRAGFVDLDDARGLVECLGAHLGDEVSIRERLLKINLIEEEE